MVDAEFAQLHVKRIELLHCREHWHLTVVLLFCSTIAGLAKTSLIFPCLRPHVFAFGNEADRVHQFVRERVEQGSLPLLLIDNLASLDIISSTVVPASASAHITMFLVFIARNGG